MKARQLQGCPKVRSSQDLGQLELNSAELELDLKFSGLTQVKTELNSHISKVEK
jgi:hypothetical protein